MKPIKSGKLAEEADLKADLANNSTRKRIKKHISNIDDKITDEDIRNVKVPGKDEPVKKEDIDPIVEENPKKNITPWNIREND